MDEPIKLGWSETTHFGPFRTIRSVKGSGPFGLTGLWTVQIRPACGLDSLDRLVPRTVFLKVLLAALFEVISVSVWFAPDMLTVASQPWTEPIKC